MRLSVHRCITSIVLTLAGLCAPCLAETAASPSTDSLRAKAEQGDPVAQDRVGFQYYTGKNRDYGEAVKWFRLSAEQGDAKGESHLGMMYFNGWGVPRDYAEAARWYREAAEQGDEHAERRLVEMYMEGKGVPQDRTEANRWNEKLHSDLKHSDPTNKWLGASASLLIAFGLSLYALQNYALPGGPRFLVAVFVHVVGIALVLNTLNTYGLELIFSRCTHFNLAISCYRYQDPTVRRIAETLGDWQMVNLIFRFMAFIGLVLDALAIWYLVYVYGRLFRRRSAKGAEA